MFNEIKKQIEWNGSVIEISTGKIARQADGAVVVKMGDSFVLCTAVVAKSAKEEAAFFPLSVNYQEKTHAVGKIPGGFLKREGKGSDKEILISRLIDRSVRPLFRKKWFNEVNVVCTVHSHDTTHAPDILSLIGTSAALAISSAPYQDIVAASRVGKINGQLVINPSLEDMAFSDLDLIVAGTKDSVMMVESEANFLTEDEMLEAIKFGHNATLPIIKLIEEFKQEVNKTLMPVTELYPAELQDEISRCAKEDIISAFAIKVKQERYVALGKISEDILSKFTTDGLYNKLQVNLALSEVKSDILRHKALENNIRIDGRDITEIRPIESEVGLLPKVHGSALFTRGETQTLVSTTLGTVIDGQIMDDIDGEYKESFLLNYIFPHYSVGENGQPRAPSRREVGHGKLAWRALKRSLPSHKNFPYTIRVVSEVTESNGSSSMATVCGASMAMMNAGIPLLNPIAGIAMGLIKDEDRFVILSDILGDEDHLGDMDFKVAGSRNGITALQMDIKVAGITYEIMESALKQAKDGRMHILEKMNLAISQTGEISDHAPTIVSFNIDKDKIRDLIGPGGRVIKDICETTGAKIDISDAGEVTIAAVGKINLDNAIKKVKDIVVDPIVGDIFVGKVVKILESGAFVNFLGNRDGFVHISEVAQERIDSVANFLKEGQEVRIKIIGFDRGKARLTIKNVDKELPAEAVFEKKPYREKRNFESAKEAGSEDKSNAQGPAATEPQKKFIRSVRKVEPKKPESETNNEIDIVERKYFS